VENLSDEYHLKELEIALEPGNPKRSMPPPLPSSQVVLDVGCGAGQTLIAGYPDRISFGLDVDLSAMQLGRSLTERVRFTQGSAEALPFKSSHFDLVFARVCIPYTNIVAALKETRRVLKPGGVLWITLHAFAIPWAQARKSKSYKGQLFFCYIVLNSALFHLIQRQFPFRGRYESFQTDSGMRRALSRPASETCISAGAQLM
jgi:ubiquinone/menaquinone biosynthesis C-methylase UbiE